MTSDGFNLLDEPWIIVLAPDGREYEVSILDLFAQAPRLSMIGGEVSTQPFAITRLLLAFLHRALDGPADQDEWAELWARPELPMDAINTYADRVRHRFELFDGKAPFFQVADLRTAKGEVSGLEKIVADVPNGAPLFTTRSAASLRRITPAEATRWLVHAHAFDPSGIKSGVVGDPAVKNGKGYPIGTGWSGQIGGVLAHGSDLRQTLLLNLIARDAETYVRIGGTDDLPPWEREPDHAAGHVDRPPNGAIELYTWQTRRVRLVGDRAGVTGVVLANGDRIQPQNRHRVEPHSAWRHSKPQSAKLKRVVYMPRAHETSRSFWRGLEALLPSISPASGAVRGDPQPYLAPGLMQWIDELTENECLPEDFVVRLRAHGVEYGAQSATYAEIIDDVLPLPVQLVRQDRPDAGRTAERAVADAEAAAQRLWRFAENVAQAAGAEPKSGAGERAQETFFSALEPEYRAWLATLRPDCDLGEARREWQKTVRRACAPVTTEFVSAAPTAAWIGRDINGRLVNVPLAEAWFNAALRGVLPLAFPPRESMQVEVQQ